MTMAHDHGQPYGHAVPWKVSGYVAWYGLPWLMGSPCEALLCSYSGRYDPFGDHSPPAKHPLPSPVPI